MRLRGILYATSLFVFPLTTWAATIHVPADQPTIQAGIDVASNGDTVLVACGTYYEHDLEMKSRITLLSETGEPECVVVDAQQNGRVIDCSSTNRLTTIEGFTFTGGDGPSFGGDGGGMYLSNSQLTIRRCEITGNSLDGILRFGGGIYMTGSSPTFIECVISHNSVLEDGGGVFCDASDSVSFEHCIFAENIADDRCGALFAWNGTDVSLDGCTFYGNSGHDGSAIVSMSSSHVTADKTIISFSLIDKATYCDFTSDITLTCGDSYGNHGSTWGGCLEGQGGVDGNFSADPGFCDAPGGDFSLRHCSPCLDAPGCGLVGAVGLGTCGSRVWHVPAEAPTIQAGIDSASLCDTVLVAAGTYYEHDIVMKSGVQLLSETGEAGCVTIDAQGLGRVISCENAYNTTAIVGFTLTGASLSTQHGGGMYLNNSSPCVTRCAISENTTGGASYDGAGVYMLGSQPVFTECHFLDNTSGDDAGGVYCGSSSHATFEYCVFAGNSAVDQGGGLFAWADSRPTVRNCTFYGNSGADGGGISSINGAEVTVENSIVAFSTGGEGAYCDTTGTIILSCSNIYGNAAGDWGACIADQLGLNGNFSTDPGFCDAPGGDYSLRACSDCLDAPGCGLVGAVGEGSCPSGLVWHVPADAPTIQAGIDSAACEDTVVVAAGTYYEHDIEMRSGIYLVSETGLADCVIIDANGLGRVIKCADADSTTVIKGFTLTNGDATAGSDPNEAGMGMYCLNSSLRISNCIFLQNGGDGSEVYGGGLFCSHSAPLITECVFQENWVQSSYPFGPWGGGLCCGNSSPTLVGCSFVGNYAYGDGTQGKGGAISANADGTLTMTACYFENNSAGSGGAVRASIDTVFMSGCHFLDNSAEIGAAITAEDANMVGNDCRFENNAASNSGGGIEFFLYGSLDLSDCSFVGNSAVNGGGAGLVGMGPYNLSHCVFYQNSCTEDGAGLYCEGVAPVLTRCTFSEQIGAGIHFNDVTQTIENTIIAFGTGEAVTCALSGSATLTCSDVYGNAGGDWTGCIAGQLGSNGNFSEDPLFCGPGDDLTLQAASPCLAGQGPCLDDLGALGQGCLESFSQATGVGEDVEVTVGPITVTYDSVETGGTTTLVLRDEGPEPPSGFQLVPSDPPIYYDLSTDASYVDSIEICLTYDEGDAVGSESALTFMHYDDSLPEPDWVDITSSLDTLANVICGITDHFSSFGLMESGETNVPLSVSEVERLTIDCYPNPFNPETTFRYGVPSAGHLNLSVYDVNGRVVKKLVDAEVVPGIHTISWDGTDRHGRNIASGVYFYRISWNGESETRRMVLIK